MSAACPTEGPKVAHNTLTFLPCAVSMTIRLLGSEDAFMSALWPRFRSRERDAQSDFQRIAAVRQAVWAALAAATKERDGVAKRLESARDRAAHIFGNASDFTEREPEETAALKEAEQQMEYASGRAKALDAHIQQLEKLNQFLNELFPN